MLERRDFMKAGLGIVASRALAETGGEPVSMTLREASAAVQARKVSPVELTKACLERITRLDGKINSFITVTGDLALEQARQAEAEILRGRSRGPLHGVPIALKDNIDTVGVRTTGASALFADRIPKEDAEVTRRLKDAGAVLLGKLNLHEFAAGGTSVVSYFGPVHNPWILDRAPGGSSGGSSAAVAARLCFGALGTDTGGSIRTPSSFCGTVGFKPTYGRVSNRNVIPLTWSLDHVGPITRTVEDAAILLNVLAGYDPLDLSSADMPVEDYTKAIGAAVKGMKIGIPRASYFDKLDPDVAKAVETALDRIKGMVASVKDVQIPATADVPTLGAAETYAFHREWFTRSPNLYQPATRNRLQRAGEQPAWRYVDARREIERLRREIRRTFETVDLLIAPTTKRPPYTIEESLRRDEAERAPAPILANTGQFNIFGLPTISIPCGFTHEGLPVGLQISGAHWKESQVLALAHAYEQATDWHKRSPEMREKS